ncbi:MAG: transposase, partial [Anaerolineales bacterium]
ARVDHEPGAIRTFIENLPEGTPVALETVGNWYWIADEIEAAGCLPLLTHATLAKYGITSTDHSDLFAGAGKAWLETTRSRLPPETGRGVAQELEALDGLQLQIAQLERRIRGRIALTPSIQLLKGLPGVGDILSIVIEREIGSIDRFDIAGQLASYAGVVPAVHASGGKTRFGHLRKPANQYLKWAFIEAANVIVRHRHHPAWKIKYVCQVYDQVCQRKGHAVAVGAVARHLAEAAFWILKRQQPYRPPAIRQASPKQVQGRA